MPKKPDRADRPLVANHAYRRKELYPFVPWGSTQLDAMIASKEFPEPFSMSDSGRAKFWFGWQILQWQQERVAASKRTKAA
jgi:predicted DNA-binding transcriptional regulator AlpA